MTDKTLVLYLEFRIDSCCLEARASRERFKANATLSQTTICLPSVVRAVSLASTSVASDISLHFGPKISHDAGSIFHENGREQRGLQRTTSITQRTNFSVGSHVLH